MEQRLREGACFPYTQVIHFFLAHQPENVGAGGGVSGENITVHHVPETDCHQWLERQQARGRMVDPKVYAGLYWLRYMDQTAG